MNNRITIPQGFYLDYVEKFCKAHGISDVGAAVQIIIGDHARLIGVDGVAINQTTPSPRHPVTPSPSTPSSNLLAGLL